jgi:hypothetical protein
MGNLKMLQVLFLSVIIIVGIVAVLLLSVVSKHRNGVKKKTILLYALVHILVFGLIVGGGAFFEADEFAVFIRLQIAALILGVAHAAWMKKFFPWVKSDGFWPELWFSLSIVLFSTVGIMTIAHLLHWQELGWLLPSALLLYFIPYLMKHTFNAYWNVPPTEYKLWYYPVGMDIPNPMEYDLSDHMKIIAFEFEPEPGGTPLNIKIKAPERMELGHYFMSFIEQYNLRNPEKEIQIYDMQGSLYGWIFYLKKPWYASAEIFDAEMTINDNGIKENQIIIAERIY